MRPLYEAVILCDCIINKNKLFISLRAYIYILSQSHNATVFYFDNISFLAHVLNQLFLPDASLISRASYRTMVLRICFQLFKKQTILWR